MGSFANSLILFLILILYAGSVENSVCRSRIYGKIPYAFHDITVMDDSLSWNLWFTRP